MSGRDHDFADFLGRLPLASLAIDLPLEDTRLDIVSSRLGRTQLVGAIWTLMPDLPEDALLSIETFGQAFGWWQTKTAGGPPAAPALIQDRTTSMRVRVRNIEDRDVSLLHQAAISPAGGFRWRYRGATPGLQQFAEDIQTMALCQLVVERVARYGPLGLFQVYDPSFHDGVANLSVLGLRQQHQPGGPIGEVFEGLYLFIDHVFRTWSFRKLNAAIPGWNWDQFAAGDGVFFDAEAVIPAQGYFDGRYWDEHHVSITRERWATVTERWDSFIYSRQRSVG